MDPEKFEASFDPLSETTRHYCLPTYLMLACVRVRACIRSSRERERERERAGVRDSLESNNLSVYNGKSKNGSALK